MNRNQLTTIGVGILLGLILLFVVLASCGPDDDGNNTGQPGASPSAPASGPGSPPPSGALPPENPSPGPTTPSGTLPPEPGEGGDDNEGSTPPTDPVATRTPAGGVDAGGGSGVSGRRIALLVTGSFLLMAALGTAGYAVRRPGRG